MSLWQRQHHMHSTWDLPPGHTEHRGLQPPSCVGSSSCHRGLGSPPREGNCRSKARRSPHRVALTEGVICMSRACLLSVLLCLGGCGEHVCIILTLWACPRVSPCVNAGESEGASPPCCQGASSLERQLALERGSPLARLWSLGPPRSAPSNRVHLQAPCGQADGSTPDKGSESPQKREAGPPGPGRYLQAEGPGRLHSRTGFQACSPLPTRRVF